jgi:mRNA interferase MazF
MLARFDIVLVAFPFTDSPNVKPRPALVIYQSERHQDVLLAFLSSKISGVANSDRLDIHADHPQFQQSGLKVSSRCLLSRMTTLPEDLRPACVRILLELVGAAEP